jgi:hypothetical protein
MINLTNRVFGRLTVLIRAGKDKNYIPFWRCSCTCGKTKVVRGPDLTSGKTKSCGCLQPEVARKRVTIDGRSKTREYAAFSMAKSRCTNSRLVDWKDYGGRGIEFRFASFEQFLADVGPRPSAKHSLDRIKTDGHYEVGNVRWATQLEQNKNQRRNTALAELAVIKERLDALEWRGATYAIAPLEVDHGA